MQIGVLSVQGNFAEHRAVLEQLGATVTEVRLPRDMDAVEAFVIPGGESTVMMKFLEASGLRKAIGERVAHGMPVLGTCAGAILLSDTHLHLMDISVDRNAYGSQADSFDAVLKAEGIGTLRATFIRAPKITRVGSAVEVLAEYDGMPVIVRQGKLLAATCHPEMCAEKGLHQAFLGLLST